MFCHAKLKGDSSTSLRYYTDDKQTLTVTNSSLNQRVFRTRT
jgi:hypothetical protein